MRVFISHGLRFPHVGMVNAKFSGSLEVFFLGLKAPGGGWITTIFRCPGVIVICARTLREQGRMMTVYSSLSLKCQTVVGVTLDQGFLNLSATDILDQMILCCGAALCSVDCSAHLWPPPTGCQHLLPSYNTWNASWNCPVSPGGKNWPCLRTTVPEPQEARSPASEVKAGAKISST